MAKIKAVMIKCCLCGNIMSEKESHNPDPLGILETDRCCSSCNVEQVAPARMMKVSPKVKQIVRGRPPLINDQIDESLEAQHLLKLIHKYFPTTKIEGFSRHIGHRAITVRRWLHGERKIPNYAFLTFSYIAFLESKKIPMLDGVPFGDSKKNPHPDWALIKKGGNDAPS